MRHAARIAFETAILLLLAGPAAAAGFFGESSQVEATAAKASKESIDQLTHDVEHMHPVAMFVLAKREFDAGNLDPAVFWFYEGQLRWRAYMRQNNMRGPGEPDQYSVFFEDIGPDINWCASEDIPTLMKVYDRVLAWDASHPDDFTPNGPAKEEERKGFKDLETYTTAHADGINKAHRDGVRSCPLDARTSNPDDPYSGSGGALLGTPPEMTTSYDTNKFSSFRIGATTKREVVLALGAPEMWSTDKDGSSTLSYSYNGKPFGVPGFMLSRRVTVSLRFDVKKVLTSIELPKDTGP